MTDDNDPDTEPLEVASDECDWETLSPTTAIVELIADHQGVEPRDMESLYGYVDPDALERLLLKGAGTDTDVVVRFSFVGYDVRLGSDGSLALFE